MKILPVHQEVISYIKKKNIEKKFSKQLRILKNNPQYPSLRTELLEPKKHGIYSFRINRKYRGLFVYRLDKQTIEVITVTDHYK
jgi:Txe/YoeB family toxin of Txe-Axe toxin-antitoxin module